MTEMAAEVSAGEAEAGVRFDLSAFARSAGLLSLGSIANLLRAVVAAKLYAVALGPSAVGILVQLLNFAAFVSTIIPLGLTTGVSKLVAQANGDERTTNRVVGSAALLSVASALAACVVLVPASGHIAFVLTGSARYQSLVALLILSFPLYNLTGAVGYVLQGMSAVRRLTRASVINAAATLAVLVPATLAFGLTGTIASVVIGSVVQSFVYIGELWLAYRERGWRLAAVRAGRFESRLLLGFGTVLLLGGIANWGSLLVVRTVLVRTLGEHDNGLYQAVYGFSSQYIAMFMTWMAAYVFPRIAARGPRQIDGLLNSALRANLFLMVPVLCVVASLRDPLIQVLYSHAFLAAAPLVPVQVLGDYVRVVGWSMGVAFFALGRVRAHLLLIAGQNALWVVFAAALMPHVGLPGISAAYALSFVWWPVLALPLLRTWFGFRLTAASWWLTGAGLAAVVAASFLPQPLGAAAIPIVPLLVLLQRRLSAPGPRIAPEGPRPPSG